MFFGNRSEMEKFAQVADILIPGMVIGEIEQQIKRKLIDQKSQASSLFIVNAVDAKSHIDSFDIEAHIKGIKESEQIQYTVIELSDPSILVKIRDMALGKRAPFESSDNTDKGFKDAYIYFTVLESVSRNPGEEYFFVARDGRLKEALSAHENIRVVETFEEYTRENIGYFYQEYFIGRMSDEFGVTATKEDILDVRQNLNGDWVVCLRNEDVGFEYLVLDYASKDLLSYMHGSYREVIDKFILSDDPDAAKINAPLIISLLQYCTDKDMLDIFAALLENESIIAAGDDEFIKEVYLECIAIYGDNLESAELAKLKAHYGETV